MKAKCCIIALAVLLLFAEIIYARDVDVSNISISNVNAGTCTINYELSRPDGPTISENQPIWVFVKYRLSTDSDYTGWQDTDDHIPSNDASDDNDDSRAKSVNANLTGDVGIVESAGSKVIFWNWGGGGGIDNGTGLSPENSVRIRVHVIEMVKVGGGNYAMKDDTAVQYRLSGTTAHSGNDYYLQKYPVTNKMYADFLNASANRHDGVDSDYDFWHSDMDNDTYGGIHITGSIPTASFAPENGHDDWPVVYVSWWNAYDCCAWAGVKLPEEEHWYKVAGESVGTGAAVSDYYWGNTAPTSSLCNYINNVGHPSDVNDYESAVDSTEDGNVYGAYELTGNVKEWMDTYWYSNGINVATPYDASKVPTAYNNGSSRVQRGGSFAGNDDYLRCADRTGQSAYFTGSYLGFRCLVAED